MFNRKEKESEAPATAAPDLSTLAQAGSSVTVAEPEPSKPAQKFKTPAELLTPEAQAYTNQLVTNAVKEIFAQMAPLLQSIALTPEKLAAAEAMRRAPTEDELAKKLREKREKKLMLAEAEENRQNLLRSQAACSHRDENERWAVQVVHNFPDRQPRFLCPHCQSFFEPRRWVVGAPDAENPRGRAYIADEHPQYQMLMQGLAAKVG